MNIAESLASRNHLVTIVEDAASSDAPEFAIFEATQSIPHVVTKFDIKSEKPMLNSSAIVSLDSVKVLEKFNLRITLPSSFST